MPHVQQILTVMCYTTLEVIKQSQSPVIASGIFLELSFLSHLQTLSLTLNIVILYSDSHQSHQKKTTDQQILDDTSLTSSATNIIQNSPVHLLNLKNKNS